MIAKKNSRFDLERKRIVLFQIGLLTASSFTLAAFTYQSPMEHEVEKRAVASQKVTFTTEFEPQKKVVKVITQNTKNDQNQTTVDLNLNPTEKSKSKKNSTDAPDPSKLGFESLGYKLGEEVTIGGDVEIDKEVFEWVDIEASYIGGRIEMQRFIQDHVSYPEEARRFGDQGTVYVSFIIEKDGSVSTVGVERGVTDALDREAKRLVRSFPKWNPAELNFAHVRTRVRLPIVFTFGED